MLETRPARKVRRHGYHRNKEGPSFYWRSPPHGRPINPSGRRKAMPRCQHLPKCERRAGESNPVRPGQRMATTGTRPFPTLRIGWARLPTFRRGYNTRDTAKVHRLDRAPLFQPPTRHYLHNSPSVTRESNAGLVHTGCVFAMPTFRPTSSHKGPRPLLNRMLRSCHRIHGLSAFVRMVGIGTIILSCP